MVWNDGAASAAMLRVSDLHHRAAVHAACNPQHMSRGLAWPTT